MPRRRRWPGLAAALLAFGLHGLALAASLVLAPGAVQMTDFRSTRWTWWPSARARARPRDGAPADGTPVASPLPKHLETAAVAEPKPTPEIRQREAKPRPVAPAPPKASAPVAVPDPAAPPARRPRPPPERPRAPHPRLRPRAGPPRARPDPRTLRAVPCPEIPPDCPRGRARDWAAAATAWARWNVRPGWCARSSRATPWPPASARSAARFW
jgi:hypothetical protein